MCGPGQAFFLPTDEDGDGRIDHLTVSATRGFDDLEVRALDRFRELRWGDGDPLRFLLVGLGRQDDFRSRLFQAARVWRSARPE